MCADELERARQERRVLRLVRPRRAAGGMREDDDVEGAVHLARPRRLADQHHARVRDRADDRRAEHVRAEAAYGERGQMLIEIHVRLRDVKRLLFILALLPFNAHAWTLPADRQIASAGAKLSPPDLYLVIKDFNRDYARGIEKGVAEEGRH